MQERYEVNGFMAEMGPENRMSDDVAEELINGMYKARRTAEKEMGFYDNENSPDSWLHMIETVIQIYKRYEKAADNILPPDQAELFNTKRKWILEEYEAAKKVTSLAIEAEKNENDTAEKSE